MTTAMPSASKHPVRSAQSAAYRHQQQRQRGKKKSGLECVPHNFDAHFIRWSAGERDASAEKCGTRASARGGSHVETAAPGCQVERSSTDSQGLGEENRNQARLLA